VGPLEVEALAGGVCGDQDDAVRVLGEPFLGDPPLLSRHNAVDG
jgi:hypothetical protein